MEINVAKWRMHDIIFINYMFNLHELRFKNGKKG